MSVGAAAPSGKAAPVAAQAGKPQGDTVTLSDEAIALLHGDKHKKKDDILLLVYPHVQIHGGAHGITAQATPGNAAVAPAGGTSGGGAAGAGGAGGGK
jgi:hypothetical protein